MKKFIIGLVTVFLVAGLGYWGYGEYQKRKQVSKPIEEQKVAKDRYRWISEEVKSMEKSNNKTFKAMQAKEERTNKKKDIESRQRLIAILNASVDIHPKKVKSFVEYIEDSYAQSSKPCKIQRVVKDYLIKTFKGDKVNALRALDYYLILLKESNMFEVEKLYENYRIGKSLLGLYLQIRSEDTVNYFTNQKLAGFSGEERTVFELKKKKGYSRKFTSFVAFVDFIFNNSKFFPQRKPETLMLKECFEVGYTIVESEGEWSLVPSSKHINRLKVELSGENNL